MTTPWYLSLTFWMYVLAGAPYLTFVLLYAIRTPTWKNTSVGRGLMTQAGSLAAVFTYICLLLAVDVPDELKATLRALLIGGVTIAGALMLRNLMVEQAKNRDPADRT